MNYFTPIILLLLLLNGGMTTTLQAQTWVYAYNPVTMPVIGVSSIEPHGIDGYLINGHYYNNGDFTRLDRHGIVQPYPNGFGAASIDFKQTPDGGYIVTHTAYDSSSATHRPALTKLASGGALQWSASYDTTTYGVDIHAARHTLDGGYVFSSIRILSNSDYDVKLTKVDAQGTALWTQQYGDANKQYPSGICATPDGGYLLACTQALPNFSRNLYLVKTDALGDTTWTRVYPNINGCESFSQTADGGFVLSGLDANNAYAIKLNQQGAVLWRTNLTPIGNVGQIQQTADGGYLFTIGEEMVRLNANGSVRWQNTPLPNMAANYMDWVRAADGGYALAGSTQGVFPTIGQSVIVKTDSLGNVLHATLDGQVYLDQNGDCQYNAGDDSLSGIIVTAVDGNGMPWHGTTGANGYYQIRVPDGTYVLGASTHHNNPYVTPCSTLPTITVDSSVQAITTDIGHTIQAYCPYMRVSIEPNLLRRGIDSSSIYTVQYCNDGTASAQNVYIEVTLDSHYVFQGSSLPVSSQQGHRYTFQLGAIAQDSCGSFLIYGKIATSADLGQVHCAEAQIYPDSSCLPIHYPIIQMTTECYNADTLLFIIANSGSDMSSPMSYFVFEDHLMLRQGNFMLDSLEQDTIYVPTQAGSIYRMEAQQPIVTGAGAPSYGVVWTFAGSCQGGIDIQSNLIIQQFHTNDPEPTRAVSCRANRGSFDPNDKTGYPLGYGANRYILPDLPLVYKIRFQNTGTDTAFRVRIVDTLPTALDATTLVMQASSHPMTWNLYGNNILEVLYEPIYLPDSNVNEPASHGFVSFQIDPQANLPLPTVVHNRAAIYFDANAPIITNTTLHTIDTGFVEIKVSVGKVFQPQIDVRVYPNPFQSQARLELIGLTPNAEPLELMIFDSMGRQVQQQQTADDYFVIEGQRFPQGIYFYRVSRGGQLLCTGQMVAQ